MSDRLVDMERKRSCNDELMLLLPRRMPNCPAMIRAQQKHTRPKGQFLQRHEDGCIVRGVMP